MKNNVPLDPARREAGFLVSMLLEPKSSREGEGEGDRDAVSTAGDGADGIDNTEFVFELP
jgi:hypothetical protein